MEAILAERGAHGPFRSLRDFFERIDTHLVNRKVVESLIITGAFDSLGENRATLLHNLPRVMEVAAKRREERRIGQASLFERRGGRAGRAVEMERQPEWPATQLLASEKENLGFFFSGHPLDRYRDVIEAPRRARPLRREGLANERPCILVGILREVREIRTRNGRTMAFAQLEDMRGSIECILFSDIYDARRALIVNDAMVGVMGKIDTTRGDPKVKVDDIMEPAALPQKPAHAGARPPARRDRQRGEPAPDAGVPAGQQGGLQPVLPSRGRRRPGRPWWRPRRRSGSPMRRACSSG